MIKKITFALLQILFTTIVFAQVPVVQWQKSLGGNSLEEAHSVQQTSDGGYIVAGVAYSKNGDVTGNHGESDAWVVKLNMDGNMLWQKSLGGFFNDGAKSIQQTSDGGYIVAGETESNSGDVSGNHGGIDAWVVKLSSTGNIQWQKCLGGSNDDYARSIQKTSDGGYILAGFTRSFDGNVTNNHGKSDAWVVKLNTTGSIEWQKALGGSEFDAAYTVQQTSDGGYIVAGESNSNNGDVIGSHGNSDAWIVKLSNIGTIQWQKALGGSKYDYAKSIQQTADGGYIVAGNTNSTDGDINGTPNNQDFWIIKLSNDGVIQWQQLIATGSYDEGRSIRQTSDGGYIVAGTSMVTANSDRYDMIKLDNNGTVRWWNKSSTSDDNGSSNSVQQTSDGGYIFVGYSSISIGQRNFWIVKFAPDYLNTTETSIKNTVTVENPVKNQLNIKSKGTITSLQLYSLDGKLIKTSNSKNMPVADLEKGVYILKIQVDNADTISKKIIKE